MSINLLYVEGTTIKILNFEGIKFRFHQIAIFNHFCKILYPRNVSKPQNCEIKYLPSLRYFFSNI